MVNGRLQAPWPRAWFGLCRGGLWGAGKTDLGAPALKFWEHICTPTPTTRDSVGGSLASARPQMLTVPRAPQNHGGCENAVQPHVLVFPLRKYAKIPKTPPTNFCYNKTPSKDAQFYDTKRRAGWWVPQQTRASPAHAPGTSERLPCPPPIPRVRSCPPATWLPTALPCPPKPVQRPRENPRAHDSLPHPSPATGPPCPSQALQGRVGSAGHRLSSVAVACQPHTMTCPPVEHLGPRLTSPG